MPSSDKSIGELRDLGAIDCAERQDCRIANLRGGYSVVDLLRRLPKRNAAAHDRGVKKAPFVVLIGARKPSALAEIGFLSNPHDETNLNKPEYRQKIAESLYRGDRVQYSQSLSHFEIAGASKRNQFSVGVFSAWSITRTSTFSFFESSLTPSCCCNAVDDALTTSICPFALSVATARLYHVGAHVNPDLIASLSTRSHRLRAVSAGLRNLQSCELFHCHSVRGQEYRGPAACSRTPVAPRQWIPPNSRAALRQRQPIYLHLFLLWMGFQAETICQQRPQHQPQLCVIPAALRLRKHIEPVVIQPVGTLNLERRRIMTPTGSGPTGSDSESSEIRVTSSTSGRIPPPTAGLIEATSNFRGYCRETGPCAMQAKHANSATEGAASVLYLHNGS